MIRWRSVFKGMLLAGAITGSGCGTDGSGGGPASRDVTVQPPFGVSPGAVVLETTRRGVVGFDASPGTRLIAEAFQEGTRRGHRIVLVGTGAPLEFSVRVADGGDGPVEFTVVSAVDVENEPVSDLRRFRVRVVEP